MVQHSQSVAITLRKLRIEKDKSPENKKLLFGSLPRLKSLELAFEVCSKEEMEDVLGRILKPGEAPHLASLELEDDDVAVPLDSIDVPEPPSSLSSLSLDNLRLFFPKTSVLSHITHLSISLISLFETSAQVDWFYDLLGQMPNLLHLHVSEHLGSYNRESLDPSRTQVVALPNLQRFRFFGPSETYVYIVRRLHLSIPTTTYHQLTFTETPSFRRDVTGSLDEIISSILKDRARDESQSSNAYHVKFSLTTKPEDGGVDPYDQEAKSIRIVVLAAPRSVTGGSVDSSNIKSRTTTTAKLRPVLTIEYQSSCWEWAYCSDFPGELSKITDSLPADAIEKIHIRSNMPLKDYEYHYDRRETAKGTLPPKMMRPDQSFLKCPNVKTVHLEGLHPIEWMCDYLTLTTAEDDAATTPQQNATFSVFPHFANLILDAIDWTKESEIDEIFSSSRNVPPIMKSVAAVLEKRAVEYDGRCKVRRLEVIEGAPSVWMEKVEQKKWVDAEPDGEGGLVWDKEARCDWDDEWDWEEDWI